MESDTYLSKKINDTNIYYVPKLITESGPECKQVLLNKTGTNIFQDCCKNWSLTPGLMFRDR